MADDRRDLLLALGLQPGADHEGYLAGYTDETPDVGEWSDFVRDARIPLTSVLAEHA